THPLPYTTLFRSIPCSYPLYERDQDERGNDAEAEQVRQDPTTQGVHPRQPEPALHLHVGEVRPAHGVSPPEKSKPFHRRSSADGRHSSHLINIVRERPPNRPG